MLCFVVRGDIRVDIVVRMGRMCTVMRVISAVVVISSAFSLSSHRFDVGTNVIMAV